MALLRLFAPSQVLRVDPVGALCTLLSGTLASGLGCAIWYAVRVRVPAIHAGAVLTGVAWVTLGGRR